MSTMISGTGRRVLPTAVDCWVCLSCRQRRTTGSKSFHAISSSSSNRKSTQPWQNRKLHHTVRYASSDANPSTQKPGRGPKLPELPARTRFAPSPTGYMHIGGLRTALFSYLLAKRTKGQFLLRIEDTDQKRLVADAEQRLCEDLQWAGLTWDEGPQVGGQYGPYKQSERLEIYQQHAKQLLNSGAAYRCFCTTQTSGSEGSKAAYVTSGCYQNCSSLPTEQSEDRAESKGDAFTVRLRLPEDAHKRAPMDLIYGKIKRLKRSPSSSQSGDDDTGIDAADTILLKSDGTPTYHLANVVDDHLMKITHVIRGTEWMASTNLHNDIYTAFGWSPPAFAHVGLLVDENKAKLSKRSNTGLVLDVKGMREEQGILPEALCNFLALLGWSNPGKNDVLELEELIRDFDLKFTKGNTIVRMEKLWFLQKQHVARKCERSRHSGSVDTISGLIQQIVAEAWQVYSEAIEERFATAKDLEDYIALVLLADSKSYETPKKFVERNRYFFKFDPTEIEHSDNFADGASAMAYTVLTRRIMETFDFTQPYREPVVATKEINLRPDAEGKFADIEQTSSLIHAAIHHGIWRALANPMWLMLPEDKYDEAVKAGHVPPAGQELEYIPFTDKAVDLQALAKYIGDKSTNPQLTVAGVEETVKAYKEWNKGMMKYLRLKLSYGLPGPGVGIIMAVLGYEECCRRLGVTPHKGGGWPR